MDPSCEDYLERILKTGIKQTYASSCLILARAALRALTVSRWLERESYWGRRKRIIIGHLLFHISLSSGETVSTDLFWLGWHVEAVKGGGGSRFEFILTAGRTRPPEACYFWTWTHPPDIPPHGCSLPLFLGVCDVGVRLSMRLSMRPGRLRCPSSRTHSSTLAASAI